MRTQPLVISLVLTVLIFAGLFVLNRQAAKKTEVGMKPAPTVDEPTQQVKIIHPPREFVPNWELLNDYQHTMTASRLQELIETVYAVGDTWKQVITITPEEATIKPMRVALF